MTERIGFSSPDNSILTQREKLNLWLIKLELEADKTPFDLVKYGRYVYLATVHIVTDTVMNNRQLALMKSPFREVIEHLDQHSHSEVKLMDSDIEEGSLVTALEWSISHPQSVHARLIAKQGLQIELAHHIGLLLEMFLDFRESRSLKG